MQNSEHTAPFKAFGKMGKDMLKNVRTVIVLMHIEKKSTHPYALLKRFRASRHPMMRSVDKSELYNLLNSLEHKGYVRSRMVLAGNKVQKVYRLTPKGKALAKEFRRMFFKFTKEASSLIRGAFAE